MLALTHADEKANANSALKTIRKIHLTRISFCTLLFCCRAAAIAFAPSSPTWLWSCKTHVGPHARRRKSKREFSAKNHPQHSSYKVQLLQAAVLLQSGDRSIDIYLCYSSSRDCCVEEVKIWCSVKGVIQYWYMRNSILVRIKQLICRLHMSGSGGMPNSHSSRA